MPKTSVRRAFGRRGDIVVGVVGRAVGLSTQGWMDEKEESWGGVVEFCKLEGIAE